MKKFSTYQEVVKEDISLENSIKNLIKENVSIEISGIDKPWSKDITITPDENLYNELMKIVEKEISLSKIKLLEELRIAVYKNTILSVIDEEIQKLK
jgi:hypothetical protein